MGRKRGAAWGTLIGIAATAAVVTALWRTSDMGRAARELEAQRAAAKREGVPMEYDDLRRLTPPVAYGDNAAVPYARAFAALQAAGNLKGIQPDDLMQNIAAGAAKPEDLKTLRTTLAALTPALAQIEEGSRRKGYSFDRKWEMGSALLFPEFASAKTAARALVLRAMLATDPAAGARDLRAAARLGARTGSEPIIISPLVGAAIESIVERGVRALGARGGAWAEAVRLALDDLGPVPDFRRSLAGEAVFSRKVIDEIARMGPAAFTSGGSDSSSQPPLALRLTRFKWGRDAMEARTLEHWRAMWAALPKDPTDWRQAKAALDQPIPQGPSYALLELTSPIFGGIAPIPAQMEADRRLSRAALDLWSGKAPTLGRDPFGAGSLRMRRTGKDWTLWSLGPDGIDQNGKPRSKKSSDDAYDLVVGSSGNVRQSP